MAVTYGFYNSSSGDRTYNALQISQLFDGLINDGVFASIGTQLMTIQNTPAAMNVLVGIGRAWFNHTWTYNDSILVLTIDSAHVSYGRIDIVVLEVDESTRTNSIKVIKGTPAAVPVQPTLTNTATLHQHLMAVISIPSGTTAITTALITNQIGSLLFPYVTGVVSSVNIEDLLIQWAAEFDDWMAAEQSDFDDWMANIIDQLSEEAAGNLQLQIDALPLDNSIEQIHLQEGASKVAMRYGGHASIWTTAGTTAISLSGTKVKIYLGVVATDFAGDAVIEYQYENRFAAAPLVFLTPKSSMANAAARVGSSAVDRCYISSNVLNGEIYWLAIGQGI